MSELKIGQIATAVRGTVCKGDGLKLLNNFTPISIYLIIYGHPPVCHCMSGACRSQHRGFFASAE